MTIGHHTIQKEGDNMNNPTVVCSKNGHNASPFVKSVEEVDNDGTQTLIKQYWSAKCGCEVEITLAVPNNAVKEA
jgi:hypothetical protein